MSQHKYIVGDSVVIKSKGKLGKDTISYISAHFGNKAYNTICKIVEISKNNRKQEFPYTLAYDNKTGAFNDTEFVLFNSIDAKSFLDYKKQCGDYDDEIEQIKQLNPELYKREFGDD